MAVLSAETFRDVFFPVQKAKLLLAALIFLSHTVAGQMQSSPEYQIKAVFLYNFTQFVEWPTSAFTDPHEPFIIGVLGEDRFGKYLDETVSGEKINAHPLVVKRFQSVDDIKDCHMVFVSEPRAEEMSKIIDRLKGRNILTVSDASEFIKNGGMIKFFNDNDKIRIRINLDAAKQANLVISSKLLRLADVVKK
jgi:hypothetical protein